MSCACPVQSAPLEPLPAVYGLPYDACVKASALRCIAQLCMQPGYAAALEAQAAMVSQMLAELQHMEPAQLTLVVEDAARLMHMMAEGRLQCQSQEVLVEVLKVSVLVAASLLACQYAPAAQPNVLGMGWE